MPLVLEIPEYRRPEPSVVLTKAKRTAARFLKDVGTTIVASAAVLWVLLQVPVSAPKAGETPIERSVAAAVGHSELARQGHQHAERAPIRLSAQEEKELVADSPKFVDQSISTSNNRPTEVHFGASDALTAKDNTGNHEHSGEEHTN